MNKKLSVFDALREALKLVLDNAHVVIPATLVLFVGLFALFLFGLFPLLKLQSIVNLAQEYAVNGSTAVRHGAQLFIAQNPHIAYGASLYVLLFYAIAIWTGVGYLRIFFDLYDNGISSVSRLFSGSLLMMLKMLAVGVLCTMAVSIGLALFVVPGVFLAVRLLFAPYYLLDKDAGVFESLQKSFHITEGHFWFVAALLAIASVAISLTGFSFAFVITIPFIIALLVVSYRKLEKANTPVAPVDF